MNGKALLVACIASLGLLWGCGSNVSNDTPNAGDPAPDIESTSTVPADAVPLTPGGVTNPTPSADDFAVVEDGKQTSATFKYYFHDAVNHHSNGRWTIENLTGFKNWHLSNTFHTEPKAWIMGANYWNNELDVLTSNPGTVEGGRKGIKVGYHGRWRIAEGDTCAVEYSIDGGDWVGLGTFTDGQNPSFPAWDRYTFYLPDCAAFDQQYQVRFVFDSDGVGVDAGFGVDRCAIYQTCIEPPLNLSATTEGSEAIEVTWDHNLAGERAANYDIYRATSEFGSYEVVGSTPYPGNSFWDDTSNPNVEYWYKAKGTKVGWDDSEFSNADFGNWFEAE